MDFTIQQALVPTEDGYSTIDVQVVAGRIQAIAPQLPLIGTPINGHDQLLLPGFVNAHTHSSEIWQRGSIPPRPLELWIAELYDFAPLDPEQVYWSALATAVETLLSGGTTVVDHLVLIPGQELATIAAAVRAYQEVGIRAFIGPLIQDQPLATSIPQGTGTPIPTAYPYSTQEVLDLIQTAIEHFHNPAAGIHLMLAPTGLQLSSDTLIAGCVALSDRYQLCRHAHLLETKAQQLLAQEKYGYSAVTHLKHLGFLGDRTSLAHCVWLDETDIDLLATTRSTVVHNPLSNLRLGSGIAPILRCRQAGVNISFGCDGAASNDGQDLLEAIKIGTMLHNTTDLDYHHWITPRQAIAMAALGGATGLGMADEFGSLTVGKQADLVLYDLKNLSLLPHTDAIGLLVYGHPTQVVQAAWVAGKPVVTQGQITHVDIAALRQALSTQSQWSYARSSPTVSQLEAHYRSVMQLPECP